MVTNPLNSMEVHYVSSIRVVPSNSAPFLAQGDYRVGAALVGDRAARRRQTQRAARRSAMSIRIHLCWEDPVGDPVVNEDDRGFIALRVDATWDGLVRGRRRRWCVLGQPAAVAINNASSRRFISPATSSRRA